MMGVGSYCCSAVETPGALIEDEGLLHRRLLPLASLRNGRDVFRLAPDFNCLLGWLAFGVKLAVPGRHLVGRVENRTFKERIIPLAPRLCYRCGFTPLPVVDWHIGDRPAVPSHMT
jgi:hypothetical protein